MNVAQLAERTGLSPHTIRYYDRMGLLPGVQRSRSGARQFGEADLAFLHFIIGLKRTGMSLEEILEFTADGCILERLEQGSVPTGSVARRTAILEKHRERLLERQRDLELLLDAVDQKLRYYEQYMGAHGEERR